MSASNVSAVTNYFATASEGFITTTGGSVSAGGTSIPLNSMIGLTNGNVFVGIIEPGVSGNEQTFTGTVDTGGSQITNVVWTRGSNVNHAGGVTVVDYVTGTAFNMITAGILKQHTQVGAHHAITTDTIATTSTATFGAGASVTNNLTVGGTAGVTGLFTPSGGLSAASVLSAALGLSSGKTGGVATQTNGGTAGGTIWSINLGGIKLLWATGLSVTTGSSANITFPTSFFSTIQFYISGFGTASGTSAVYQPSITINTTVSATIALTAGAGSGTEPVTFFAIGT